MSQSSKGRAYGVCGPHLLDKHDGWWEDYEAFMAKFLARKPGRPRQNERHKRRTRATTVTSVCLTWDIFDRLAAAAESDGVTRSDWIRTQISKGLSS